MLQAYAPPAVAHRCGTYRNLLPLILMAQYPRPNRRGGRVVYGSGLEIRIQDFGLNWTGLADNALAFCKWFLTHRSIWTGLAGIGLDFFERVTFTGD
jgi:hypothetical protein